MPTFENSIEIKYPRESVFDWYASRGAFNRVMPEWEKLTPLEFTGGFKDGTRNTFRMRIGPFPKKWVAEHSGLIDGYQFHDSMKKGPFSKWEHTHIFEDIQDGCKVIDRIEWKLPFHILTSPFGSRIVTGRMKNIFRHRNRRLVADLKRHNNFKGEPKKRILVTGSTGLIGEQLCCFLNTGGHQVVRLARPETKLPPDPGEVIHWDPESGELSSGSLEGFDAVIHLAGAGIGDKRWSKKRKSLIRDSRVGPTNRLCILLSELENPPEVFLSASAIGWYGDRGDEEVNEDSASGKGFLPDVCQEWEDATAPASNSGIRVVKFRSGVVVTPIGGMLSKIIFPTKMGAGGPISNGKQYLSWISLDDEIYAIHHLLMRGDLGGAYNLTAPMPVMQKQFAKILGKVLWRPSFAPLPKPIVLLMFGEMGRRLLLEGQRVSPNKLIESGYVFEHQNLESCLRDALGRWRD